MSNYPKLMKSKEYGTIVFAKRQYGNMLTGTVIANSADNAGQEFDTWDVNEFEDYELPQCQFEAPRGIFELFDNPTPTKDVELRLECLKLAVKSNQGVWQNPETLTTDADIFYDWITKADNQ
jgi:hypothetical protein